MTNLLFKKTIASYAMGFMLLSVCADAAPHSGTLDTTFNPGGPKQGEVVVSMSPATNLALGLGIQKDHSDDSCCSKAPPKYKIVLAGDAVQQVNPLQPLVQSCPADIACYPYDCCGFEIPCDPTCFEFLSCFINGFIDQRGWSMVRLFENGGLDKKFGPNNNGRVFFEPSTILNPYFAVNPGLGFTDSTPVIAATSAQNALVVDHSNRLVYGGLAITASSAILCGPSVGQIGIGDSEADCGFSVSLDSNHGDRPYGQTAITLGRFRAHSGALDTSFAAGSGHDGLFVFPHILLSQTVFTNHGAGLLTQESLGDYVVAITQDSKERIIGVGGTSLDIKGCFYSFPLIFRVVGGDHPNAGYLDSSFNPSFGFVVEGQVVGGLGSGTDVSYFDDLTGPNLQNLGYAQYEGVVVQKDGKIIAVGDADYDGQTWPISARIIVARYNKDGSLDQSFGGNGTGRLVLSAQFDQSGQPAEQPKQLLARSVAVDDEGNIYIGGDIANNGEGPPGAASFSSGEPSVLVARPTANFLLIKLNKHGKPVDFGPVNCQEECNTSVFQSCTSCNIYWRDVSSSTNIPVRVVTTDFDGFDDAIFSLLIDNKHKTITAGGQMSQDAALQSMKIGFARYHLKDGSLDRSFGTSGLVRVDGGRNRRTLIRNMVYDPVGKIIAAGQSGFSEEEITEVNFNDATEKDFCVIRLNK